MLCWWWCVVVVLSRMLRVIKTAATAPRGHDSIQINGGKADPLRKTYGRH